MSYPVPPNALLLLTDARKDARKRLQDRDRHLRENWTKDRVNPGRGPVKW